MFIDFQKYRARAQSGQPAQMQSEQVARQPAATPRAVDRDREDFRFVLN
jgi:hypothetical protein